MPVILTPQAELDLEEIGDFIAKDSPRRAETFVRELYAQCVKIARNPVSYRLRPELATDIRSCAYGNYVIFFEVNADAVLVVRILHGARDIAQEFVPD